MSNEDRKTVFRAFIIFVLLLPLTSVTMAKVDIANNLICPCECAMIISTCDCPAAMQVKKEIGTMEETGFSEKQIITALQAEYGSEILHHEKASSMPLWMAGIPLAIILVFLGYIITKKPNLNIIPDREKYEKRFEEEYRKFVSEFDEPNKNISPFSNGSSKMEEA